MSARYVPGATVRVARPRRAAAARALVARSGEPQVDHDLMWQHQPSHFWLVLVTAVISSRARDQGRARSAPARRRTAVPRRDVVPHRGGVPRAARARHADACSSTCRTPASCSATPVGLTLAVIPAVASAFLPAALATGRRARTRRGCSARVFVLFAVVGRVVARAVAARSTASRRSSNTAPTSPIVRGARRDAVLRRRASSTSCST